MKVDEIVERVEEHDVAIADIEEQIQTNINLEARLQALEKACEGMASFIAKHHGLSVSELFFIPPTRKK